MVGCTECPCGAILGDGAAFQSLWGHKGGPSWGGCPSGRGCDAGTGASPAGLCSPGALCQHQACAIMGKLPAECFFNLERNNLISNYWCRTLGESLQRVRTGCFTGAACQFCHLIIKLFRAKTLDRQREKNPRCNCIGHIL